MQTFTLQNEQLRVGIRQTGAELASIYSHQNKLEYLWQADPRYWKRHSSILFPIVGKLAHDTFRLDDKAYHLSQHGFARDMDFVVDHQDDKTIKLQLKDTQETLKLYPFAFQFDAIYTLEKNKLYITYEISNPGEEPLLFSLGAHPAFNVPVLPDTRRSDYGLRFETAETTDRILIADGLRTGETSRILDDAQLLPITDDLFDQDALIFASLRSEELSLIGPEDQEIWKFGFSGFPYLGIWSKSKEAPFVCIEPWHGVADEVNYEGPFHLKDGIIALPGKAEFTCTHWVEIV
ncbi:MAG: aldose 1-epimerase family protein [Saprospiraceae bacterium]|nr:aldose 1-epimerase family protein [Saprospiraceae bacterium]MCB9318127.1 aldose 1-epimerase family protein [Lewinellaceae bacterium]